MNVTKRVARAALSACLFCVVIFSSCSDSGNEPVPEAETDPVRKLFDEQLDHPAVWNESEFRTYVNKIDIAGDRESYNFLVSTNGLKQTQFIGQTEKDAIRKDFTKGMTPSFYAIDICSFKTDDGTSNYLSAGGLDLNDTYKSRADLDEIALPFAFTKAPEINLTNYKASFTSMSRANTSGENSLNGDRNFYIAGNAYDGNHVARPFIATLTARWYFFSDTWTGQLTTLTFMDLQGNDLLTMQYKAYDGFYILTIDNINNELSISYYTEVDVNKNRRFDLGDSYSKVWSTRLPDVKVDRTLANFAITENKLFVAGTVTTSKGDQAGKIISLDKKTGSILLETTLDYSDDHDGFYGAARSGDNVFAYGYSHQTKSGNEVLTSRGWAVKFSLEGKALYNYLYKEDDTVIEFTTGTGGIEQGLYDGYGTFAIGGMRKRSTGYAAFATEFSHRYKNGF